MDGAEGHVTCYEGGGGLMRAAAIRAPALGEICQLLPGLQKVTCVRDEA